MVAAKRGARTTDDGSEIVCALDTDFRLDLACRRGSVGQSKGLLIPRSSVQFGPKFENSSSHGFELYGPSIKGTKLLLKVIKAIIVSVCMRYEEGPPQYETNPDPSSVIPALCFAATIGHN